MNSSSESPDRPDPAPEAARLLRRQAEALERLALVSDPEYKPRKKLLQKLVAVAVAGGGVVLATYQFAIYVKESYERRTVVANHVQVAREMFEEEQSTAEALALLDRAAEIDGQDVEVIKARAYIEGMQAVERLLSIEDSRPFNAEDVKLYGKAMGQARMLKRVERESADWAILQGQLALALRDFETAEERFNEALKLEPSNAFAMMRLGVLHWARARGSGQDDATVTRRLAESRRCLAMAAACNPRLKWIPFYEGEISLWESNREDEGSPAQLEALARARRSYQASGSVRGGFVQAEIGLGNVAMNLHDWPEAIGHFDDALRRRPGECIALTQIAQAYGHEDRYEAGYRYAKQATEADQHSPEAWYWRGYLACEIGKERMSRGQSADADFGDALKSYSAALDLNPESSLAYAGRARLRLDRGEFAEAFQDVVRGRQFLKEIKDPDDRESVRINLDKVDGECQFRVGLYEDAIATYGEKLLSQSPRSWSSRMYRGLALERLGQTVPAAEDLDAAVECSQGKGSTAEARTRLARGQFLTRAGKLEQALEDFTKARTAKPDMLEAWLEEARTLRALGRMEASRAAARGALTVQPACAEARDLAGR